MPLGYGRSYHCIDQDATICHPIPINLIVGLWHRFYWRLARGFEPDRLARAESELGEFRRFKERVQRLEFAEQRLEAILERVEQIVKDPPKDPAA
jgi:hypothetical protein